MLLKVVILWQYLRRLQLLLEYLYKIQQILRLMIADVIDFVANVILIGKRASLHDLYNPLYNIVDVREVTSAVPVVEDLNRLILYQLVRESKVRHVRAPSRAVYREET